MDDKKEKKEKIAGRIILDTNFLFVPFYYKIDIFEELFFNFKKFEIQIPNLVFLELEKIKRRKRKGKDRIYVDGINNMIKDLVKSKKVTIVVAGKESKDVDNYIIDEVKKMKEKEMKEKEMREKKMKEKKIKDENFEEEKLGICTNDKNLKNKIREIIKKESLKNVFIISSRGKKLIF